MTGVLAPIHGKVELPASVGFPLDLPKSEVATCGSRGFCLSWQCELDELGSVNLYILRALSSNSPHNHQLVYVQSPTRTSRP